MPERFTYLAVLLGCGIVPFLFSFHPKLRFYRHWKAFFFAAVPVLLFFVIWDVLFVRLGVWRFNPRYVTGIEIAQLPLEEILFFLVIPYCSVFTLHSFDVLLPDRRMRISVSRTVVIVLAVLLVVIASVFIRHLYTSVTFLLLAAFLLWLSQKKAEALPRYLLTWAVILLPFFLSNGILTGSFLQEPVVIYNDAQNLGVRLFTIPFEDVFYGMLLLLLNFSAYDWWKSREVVPAGL